MLEKKLQEELDRFRSINKYARKLMMEQDVPPPPEETPPPPPPPGGDAPAEDVPPPPDATAPGDDTPPPPPGGEAPMTDPSIPSDTGMGGEDTQEMDITDLVNMTTSIKKDLEAHTQDNGTVIAKMDDVFTKLTDLEHQLSQMDNVIAKIDELGAKVETMKDKTPEEKLEMRSLDSYPFNQNPQEFFAKKQEDMRSSGKNEYVLTKGDVQDYSIDSVKKSFNPNDEEQDDQELGQRF
jgi:hypothetical protein